VKSKLLIIANNNIGTGQSGGDTIFLEFIKNWQKKLDTKISLAGGGTGYGIPPAVKPMLLI